MVFKHAHIVPIILCIWFPLTFALTYCVAVYNKNVTPVFPYISDTGSWAPESCIFDILLTIAAILMAIIMYVRYRQVRELCENNEFKPITKKLNKNSLYLGVCATFGVIIVGCFQETNALIVHVIGAGMCFGLGTIYQIEQVVISFLIFPTFGTKCVNIFRAICVTISIITFGLTSGFALIAMMQFEGEDLTKWTKKDGGFDFHLVSVFAEWILVIATQSFLTSFAGEFKQIHFSEPAIRPIV